MPRTARTRRRSPALPSTSEGFKEALADALGKAGVAASDLTQKEVEAKAKNEVNETHQVIVVGAGGAGLIAAIKAKEAGADVIVLEKCPLPAATPDFRRRIRRPRQRDPEKEGIEDSADKMYEDVLVAGGKPELIRVLADKALEGANWLKDDAGVVWEDEMMFFGGHSVEALPGAPGRQRQGDHHQAAGQGQ